MKERPILFNGDMVRAILDGRKAQTRRVVKADFDIIGERDDGSLWPWREDCENGGDIWYPCPYGQPGDRLWVRETFSEVDCRLTYRADTDDGAHCQVSRWTPSIYMPRWASRITLEITGVRVERLQDISQQDAMAEGCLSPDLPPELRGVSADYVADERTTFAILWNRINGPGSWAANPWLWVIEFERVEAPARTGETA